MLTISISKKAGSVFSMSLEKACVQVYTGNGKGKTTAALGLAVRAWSAGLRVRIVQFMKPWGCSAEQKALANLGEGLEIACFGVPGFCRPGEKPKAEEFSAAALALAQAKAWLLDCDLLILDEINNAVFFGLISAAQVLALIQDRPPQTELVLTGRSAPPEIIQAADLVTEMKKIKHYADSGLSARLGIEY
jgi:cob(I)alamin adenosyltransferase